MSMCSIYDPLFWDVTDLSSIIIHKDSKDDDYIEVCTEFKELIDSWRSAKVPAFIHRYNINNLFYSLYRHQRKDIIHRFDFTALSLDLHVKLGYCTKSILDDHLQDLYKLYEEFNTIIEHRTNRHTNLMYIFKYAD